MKHLSVAFAAALACLAAPAAADGHWGGAYVGFSVSSTQSNTTWSGLPFDWSTDDSMAPGLFAGYNVYVGDGFLVGGEVTFTNQDTGSNPTIAYGAVIDTTIRVRVGADMGDALVYAAAGYAMGEFDIFGAPFTGDGDGYVLAGGLDYMLTENLSLRAEFSQSHIESDDPAFPPAMEADIQAFTLGAAFHF